MPDDDTTQVTKLYEAMDDALDDVGEKAEEVSKKAQKVGRRVRRDKTSYPRMKAAISSITPRPKEKLT